MVAVVKYSGGAMGTVVSVHDGLRAAMDSTPKDADGCTASDIRYWWVSSVLPPGTLVVLADPNDTTDSDR